MKGETTPGRRPCRIGRGSSGCCEHECTVGAADGDVLTPGDGDSVILEAVGDSHVDLVISDMAPNMSGTPAVDMPRAMFLCELALDLATRVLKPGGDFLIKIFQGEGFDVYLKDVRSKFDKVQMRKPSSSRDRSREQYLLGRGFKGA